MTQEEFRACLDTIVERANCQGSYIDKNDINEYLIKEGFEGSQLELVYNFLLSKKIRVGGYEKGKDEAQSNPLTEEAKKEKKRFQEIVDSSEKESKGEAFDCLRRYCEGDLDAKDRLMELALPYIIQMAVALFVPEVHLSDLIQEGNLHFLLALSEVYEIEDQEGDLLLDLKVGRMMLAKTREGIEALLEEQRDLKKQDKTMVDKVEDLKDSVAILKEEMGRKVYLDEVADFMNITEDEASAIFGLTGENVPNGTE